MVTPEQREANKRAALQIGEATSSGDLDALDDVLAEDIVARWPGLEPVRGREAYKETICIFRTALPDVVIENHDAVAEADTVSRYFTARGTHEGGFMGVEPTGREAEVAGMNLARFEEERVVEETTCFDLLGLFQQLGVVEPPVQ